MHQLKCLTINTFSLSVPLNVSTARFVHQYDDKLTVTSIGKCNIEMSLFIIKSYPNCHPL